MLSIGLVLLTVWAQAKLSEYQNSNAANAGRAIAAYSRAASVWLAENPPAIDGIFTLSVLQDCADPAGVRYLSCTFGAQTPVTYARNDIGDRVNFGNLIIDVEISSAGATGVIDFGVFRSGDDENEDGLPDSRPDLAAIAFQTAAEETGAGVLDFFEMRFARESPAGLQFDPNEASFDQAAIDDLARLQARVGALAGDAPFLRLDGANEMSAGISFDNGMQVNMDGPGLEFQGPGDVGVSTDTGTLVVTQNIQTAALQTAALQSDSAVIDELTVEPLTGVKGAGFERLNQAPDVIRIDDDVIRLTSRVQTNETDIIANRQNITDNEIDINRLTGEVTDNEADISANRRNISTQDTKLSSQSRRISAIENRPPPPPPPPPSPICSPSLSSVQPSGYPSSSCNTSCNFCGTATGTYTCSGSTTTVSYEDRDPYTLNCVTRSATFYSSRSCTQTPGACNI